MFKIRWLMLGLWVAVLVPAVLRGEIECVVIALIIGVFYGLVIDLIGVGVLKLWKYSSAQWGWEYFTVTVPCWGIFSMVINLVWNWIGTPWSFIFITLGLFAMLELPNLKTRSWTYNAPMWLVMIGWIPLVLSFRIVYITAICIL